MNRSSRIPPLAASFLLAVGLALTLLVVADVRDSARVPADGGPPAPRAPFEPASAKKVAERLAGLRKLEFDQVPEIRRLSAEDWRQRVGKISGRQEADAANRRESAAVEDVLRLAGLAPPDFDAAEATAGVGELVGGFYRPKAKRLYLVEQPLLGTRGTERIQAHELEHALQDQNYPKALRPGGVTGEKEIALAALIEGDASVVERRYARRFLGLDTATADRSLLSPANLAVGLPPALVASVRFPYTSGADFVRALRRRGGWAGVDEAFRDPPTTTEQILHPAKWIAGEEGTEVATPPAEVLGRDWRRIGEVDSGELDAIVILASGVPADVARRAAKGWDGGAFGAYRIPGSDCEGVCRDSRAAVVAYRWETPADAAEFAVAATRYVSERVPRGPHHVELNRRTTAVAFAPTRARARRLAKAGAVLDSQG